MVIRGRLTNHSTDLLAYTNQKGDISPLSVIHIDQPIEKIERAVLKAALDTLRLDAAEKFARRSGLLRYTANGGL